MLARALVGDERPSRFGSRQVVPRRQSQPYTTEPVFVPWWLAATLRDALRRRGWSEEGPVGAELLATAQTFAVTLRDLGALAEKVVIALKTCTLAAVPRNVGSRAMRHVIDPMVTAAIDAYYSIPAAERRRAG